MFTYNIYKLINIITYLYIITHNYTNLLRRHSDLLCCKVKLL